MSGQAPQATRRPPIGRCSLSVRCRPGPATAHRHRGLALPPPINFACNYPTTLSNLEFTTLELQRFRTLLKLHPIELHAKLLRGCALARTWARYLARGPDTWRVDPVVCAWAAPRRISRGWRACYGLTSMFSGSRASGTPGQAPLCSQRRPPCPRHAIVGVCGRGGLYCGRRCPEARPHRQ